MSVFFVSTKIINLSEGRSEGASQGRSEGASQDLPKDLL
jgi:hypothetical protein